MLAQFNNVLIVIDELDRLSDASAASLLADAIKGLSDHAVGCTIVLVGVADSVDTLIAEHQSVERALVQVRMPRMSKTELYEILNKGLSTVAMSIDDAARDRIAMLSQGLPHYAHLLGLHAAQRAIFAARMNIISRWRM